MRVEIEARIRQAEKTHTVRADVVSRVRWCLIQDRRGRTQSHCLGKGSIFDWLRHRIHRFRRAFCR